VEQGIQHLRDALAEARSINHLYDEWRCLSELQELGVAGPEEAASLESVGRTVQERLGVVGGPASAALV
jgi:hypothetical protein